MQRSPSTALVTARTNLPAPSAVAALDACLRTQGRDLNQWTVRTPAGGLRLLDTRSDGPNRPLSSRQLPGDLDVGRGRVVPVEVELIDSRRRCVVALRPSAPAWRPAGASRAAFVRAANEAAEALASTLELTVQQWMDVIDDHAGH